jgi:hypothetical protein
METPKLSEIEGMKVENSNNYTTVTIRYVLILVAAFLFSIVTKPEAWELSVSMGLIVVLWIISKKFTQRIDLDSETVTITYFRFLTRKELQVPVEGLEVKLTKEATFRSPKYFLLKIFFKRKHLYTIDSRDGFREDELRQLLKRAPFQLSSP